MIPHTLLLDLHTVQHAAWTRAADRSRLARPAATSRRSRVTHLWKGPSRVRGARRATGSSTRPLTANAD
jgi:hypothetical protein